MLFDPSSPANKFGYFKAGNNFCSYSLFETQEYASKTSDEIEWNFNDEFFSTIDWTIEPAESLKELYAERARQIRNNYDYIVLTFSGGSDSHNILSTFLENDIYIDEILTYHAYEGIKDKLSPVGNMVEITLAAIPEANRYIEKFPTTLHRIVDISEIIKDYWEENISDLKYNFIYYNNYYATPYNMVCTNLPTILPEYQRLTDSGKRVCFIHGNDKPYIHITQGKWYFAFCANAIDSSFSPKRQFEKTSVNDVLFYWDPDAWKIPVKQAHVLRNYLYKNHHIVKSAMQGKFNSVDPKFLSSLRFMGNPVPMNVVKNAIYPYWKNDIIDVGKAAYSMYGIKSQWWSTSALPGTKEHIAGIQHIGLTNGSGTEQPRQPNYFSKKHYF
jgi:hypothetical protein